MSRTHTRIALLAALLAAFVVAAVTCAPDAHATTSLGDRLLIAQRELTQAQGRLDQAEAALAAALATQGSAAETSPGSDVSAPSPDVVALQQQVDEARLDRDVWQSKVDRLTAAVQQEQDIEAWENDRDWMPIIKIAAAKYHVKAAGMYRMMMRESGGDPRAGAAGQFRGLYQYWTETWKNEWNPWRKQNIFDGSSQIFATAYAIHKGMGPQMWTTTFATQY